MGYASLLPCRSRKQQIGICLRIGRIVVTSGSTHPEGDNVEEMTCSNKEFPTITIDILDTLVRELKEQMPSGGLYLTNWVNRGYTLPNGDLVVPERWLADINVDEREGIEAWHAWTLRRDCKERLKWRG